MNKAFISVYPNEEIGYIHPNLHGHFIEHIGTCVYDGIWVGPESKIPNINGIRKDVVDALSAIHPPVFRWPGGCFADQYHWMDGIGERDARPSQVTSRWGPDEIENNAFGTHEFMEFCRLLGAEPWMGGNVATGTSRQLRDWVEYCNISHGTTMAQKRRENGAEDPFRVKYWGIGNESWDCGGKFVPETYADAYRTFESSFPNFHEQDAFLIACGPDGNKEYERKKWTRDFFERISQWRKPRMHGYDAHFYTWNIFEEGGSATEYSRDQWYYLIRNSMQIEKFIKEQRAIIDEFEAYRQVGLIIGEWGTWHRGQPGDPMFWNQNTIRDAIIAASTLDIFHKHCDKVVMANLAQTVNILQSLILTKDDKMLVTPTYHVFNLYQGHKGGRCLKMEVEAGEIMFQNKGEKGSLPGLSGSASVKGDILTLSLTNLHADEAVEATVDFQGGEFTEPSIRQIHDADICAHNTFDVPDKISPQAGEPVRAEKAKWHFMLPTASVTVFTARRKV